jgi:signal peptidase I
MMKGAGMNKAAAHGKAAAPAGAASSVMRDLMYLLLKIAAVIGVAALLLTFVYGFHRSAEAGMAPSVKAGDLLMFYRVDKEYAPGDLLILSFEGERQVRRVVAVAGDSVDITKDGLIVNGAMVQEPYISGKTERYAGGVNLPLEVDEGCVFVLGDSRENATDSRVYGSVKTGDTLGTALALMRRHAL